MYYYEFTVEPSDICKSNSYNNIQRNAFLSFLLCKQVLFISCAAFQVKMFKITGAALKLQSLNMDNGINCLRQFSKTTFPSKLQSEQFSKLKHSITVSFENAHARNQPNQEASKSFKKLML